MSTLAANAKSSICISRMNVGTETRIEVRREVSSGNLSIGGRKHPPSSLSMRQVFTCATARTGAHRAG